MRQTASYPISDLAQLKQQLLAWAAAQPVAAYLDSNAYPGQRYGSWDCLVGAGVCEAVTAGAGTAFPLLKKWYDTKQDWLFGFLCYDLKNEVEQLQSGHFDGVGFPDLYFFQPQAVAGIRAGRLEIFAEKPEAVWQEIQNAAFPQPIRASGPRNLQPRFPKADYLATVEAVRQRIVEGDLYEMNLCMEFFEENVLIEPARVFQRLNAIGKAPFSAFFRLKDQYLLCASPERFLRKEGVKLISQPIKGTCRRGSNAEEDELLREALRQSEKDRAEHIMIVDLVRNDLARHCQAGSVQVEELFGLYAFETVHQMISTVTGVLRAGAHPIDALRDAFPMGSMTGAPKVTAMRCIEQYEYTRRGLYSGAVGYVDPEGDFDFNVVIRSILYNSATQYCAFQTGGAIVYDSVPELEYEECMVKAAAMLQAVDMA